MATPQSPPAFRSSRDKAPESSAALLALQQKGLKLPLHCNTSTPISPQSTPAHDPGFRVSPLSIISTPSNFRPSPVPTSEPGVIEFAWRRGTSSTASVETTITGILNLYTNLSKQSFKSEYEDQTPYPDSEDESEDDAPPSATVHQPKAQAYRDTIAPLLEHQFSNSSLMIPRVISPGPSPMSLASMPVLMHPNASLSVPSLQLAPDSFSARNMSHEVRSGTSIQVTPEISPVFVPLSTQGTASESPEERIVLEVPDVREADSWYDQPLSPISPEDLEYRNVLRESQQSAVSPQSPATQTNHFRSLAFESLSPPSMNLKTSPGLRSVQVVEADRNMVPPPLDFTRNRTLVSRVSTPARQLEIVREIDNERGGAKSQHPSLMFAGDTKKDFIDGPSKTSSKPLEQRMSYTTVESDNTKHLSIQEIERPCSAFSDSSDSYVIHDTISGQVKAMWKEKFGKKKDKKRKSKEAEQTERKSVRTSKGKEREEKVKSGPTMTKNVTTAFSDERESYMYPYKTTPTSVSGTSEKQATESYWNTSSLHDERPSTGDEPRPPMSTRQDEKMTNHSMPAIDPSIDEPEPVLDHPAIPLTKYQKHGIEFWYESNKKKRQQERERVRKEAEKSEKMARDTPVQIVDHTAVGEYRTEPVDTLYTHQHPHPYPHPQTQPYPNLPPHIPSPFLPGFYQKINHAHTTSNETTKTTTSATTASSYHATTEDPTTNKQYPYQRSNTGKSTVSDYNNALFEASGGEKKRGTGSGFASRLMMSSEEKRKRKVKESIVVVGSGKMRVGVGGRKGLVKI